MNMYAKMLNRILAKYQQTGNIQALKNSYKLQVETNLGIEDQLMLKKNVHYIKRLKEKNSTNIAIKVEKAYKGIKHS